MPLNIFFMPKSTSVKYIKHKLVRNIIIIEVIEKCTNFYFGTEKLPPKF